MYKLKITLKQHTPLIHFQHDQDGATLRASEVKPKLDRFIIKHEFKDIFHACKEYLTGYNPKKEEVSEEKFNNGFKALDYQVRIKGNKRNEDIKLDTPKIRGKYHTKVNGNEDFPFLLANMGGKTEEKELLNLSLHETVSLVYIAKNEHLHNLIKKYIILFFARHNFGQRATKGFGSFTVTEINGQQIEWIEEDLFNEGTLLMEFSLKKIRGEGLLKQYALFKTLDFYWKCLKSGINYTIGEETLKIRYIKAFLWKYLDNKGINWEKRKIKQHFGLLTGNESNTNNESNKPSFFMRSLLGCPDKFEYKTHNKTVNVEHIDNEIARIPTPIIFKPVVWKDVVSIYILFDPSIRRNLRKEENVIFRFRCNNNEPPLEMDIDLEVINFKELIEGYHKSFSEDQTVKESVFYGIPENAIDNENYTMIPRDFNWNNILGHNMDVKFYVL